jgi:hypothetical protein
MTQRILAFCQRVDAPFHHVSTMLDCTACIGKRNVDLIGGFNGNGHAKVSHGRNPTGRGVGSYDSIQ